MPKLPEDQELEIELYYYNVCKEHFSHVVVVVVVVHRSEVQSNLYVYSSTFHKDSLIHSNMSCEHRCIHTHSDCIGYNSKLVTMTGKVRNQG